MNWQTFWSIHRRAIRGNIWRILRRPKFSTGFRRRKRNVNNFLPYIIIQTQAGQLKFLIDTDANRNYIDPAKITSEEILDCTPTCVNNIDGSHEINQKIKLTVFPNKPPLDLIFFKFHPFFDGLIGYESLRDLGVEILTSTNTLKLPEYSIQMLRKYPDSFSVSLNAHEEVPVVLNTNINSGDFYIDHPFPLTEDVMVVPGLYRANHNKAQVLLKNRCNFSVKCSPNRSILSELNNFEERK